MEQRKSALSSESNRPAGLAKPGQRVLFFYTHKSTFVKCDVDVLKEIGCSVYEYKVVNVPKSRLAWSLVKQFFYLLFVLPRYDIVYVWFADYHSYLPMLFAKLYRKRSFLTIGGYDICRDRRLGYGSFINPLRGCMTRRSMEMATLCICISSYVERTVKWIAPKSRRKIVYNTFMLGGSGSDDMSRSTGEQSRDPKSVLCVALVSSVKNYYIKGIDRYVEVARAMPDFRFTLVGTDPSLIVDKPDNLVAVPRVEHNVLIDYYLTHHIYCQPSRRESFSLSLAEAIYFGAVPVISYVGGMPEVLGDTVGYLVQSEEVRYVENCASAIVSAADILNKKSSSMRIVEVFGVDVKKRALSELLS